MHASVHADIGVCVWSQKMPSHTILSCTSSLRPGAGLESLSSQTQEFSYLHLPGPGIQLHHHTWHFYNVSSGARTQVFVLARQPLPTESPPQPPPRFLSRFHLCHVHAYMSRAVWRSEDSCGSRSSPSTTWVLGIKLRSPLPIEPPLPCPPLYRTPRQITKLPALLGLEVEPLTSSPLPVPMHWG